MPANRNVTNIETYSGQLVDLLDPRPETIRLVDIATALSNIPRFGGGISRFYSVAEHAVRVSDEVPTLEALHHDSHEAYIGDLTAPLKKVLNDLAPGLIAGIAEGLDRAIVEKLGLNWFQLHSARIKVADDAVMYREAATLKWSHGTGEHWLNQDPAEPYAGVGWSPSRAERMFIARHYELVR